MVRVFVQRRLKICAADGREESVPMCLMGRWKWNCRNESQDHKEDGSQDGKSVEKSEIIALRALKFFHRKSMEPMENFIYRPCYAIQG
jgi:hypothetical protein